MMKKSLRILCFSLFGLALIAMPALSQNLAQPSSDPGEEEWHSYDVTTGQITPYNPNNSRVGNVVFDNFSKKSWWSIGHDHLGYILLDWGKLYNPMTTGLSGELIDGFDFRYSANDETSTGLTMEMHFYDSCTGVGNIGILEAAFVFTGMPNSYGNPGQRQHVINVDLDGTGQQFLLGPEIGWAHVFHNGADPTGQWAIGPVIGRPPNKGLNGPTGTENLFDIYYPNGNPGGTWWFGGDPWATWPIKLYGGAAASATYYGVGQNGNDAELYADGEWVAGQPIEFMMRNPLGLNAYVLVSTTPTFPGLYYPSLDVTRLIGDFYYPLTTLPMTQDIDGDFVRRTINVPNPLPPVPIYFQGASLDPASFPPADMSNAMRYM